MSKSSHLMQRTSGNGLERFFLLLALAYYLPVILIWVGVISFDLRFHVLVGMALVMAVYSWLRKIHLSELGFRKDTLFGSLLWNGLLSAVFVALLYTLYFAGLIRTPTVPEWRMFFIFYVFISSPAQEFIFRSVIFAEMKRLTNFNPIAQIVVSTITYSFLHVIYNDLITLFVTAFMGVVWGILYYRYPNFWGVTLSHAVLGVVSISVGLI